MNTEADEILAKHEELMETEKQNAKDDAKAREEDWDAFVTDNILMLNGVKATVPEDCQKMIKMLAYAAWTDGRIRGMKRVEVMLKQQLEIIKERHNQNENKT